MYNAASLLNVKLNRMIYKISGSEETASVKRSFGRRGANSETDHLADRFLCFGGSRNIPEIKFYLEVEA